MWDVTAKVIVHKSRGELHEAEFEIWAGFGAAGITKKFQRVNTDGEAKEELYSNEAEKMWNNK